MRSTILSALCALALVADAFAVFVFEPGNSTNIQVRSMVHAWMRIQMIGPYFKDQLSNRLSSVQTLAASQLTSNHGSWWIGSLITGKNHRQFFVISQYVSLNGTRDLYRASVLDLDSLELLFIVQLGDGSHPSSDPSRLVVGVGGDGFEGISDGNLGIMRTQSTHGGVTFDLIYHRTTLPLVNGGPDITFHDDGKAYGFKLSIWAGDGDGDVTGEDLATIRDRKGSLTLTPVSVTPDMENTWYSLADKKTYPLSWTIHIPDYIAKLTIASTTADQLIVDSTSSETAYEGFVTFNGVFLSAEVAGYGMVEIVSK